MKLVIMVVVDGLVIIKMRMESISHLLRADRPNNGSINNRIYLLLNAVRASIGSSFVEINPVAANEALNCE